jgi:transcriptional regulator with XRE-family HTH domain
MCAHPSLGSTIRARRGELGLTQEELAERISADGEYLRQSDVSRLERGAVELPRRARLERIAAALGLSTGELLARSGWAKADAYFDMADVEPSARAMTGLPDLDALRGRRRTMRALRQSLSVQAARLARNQQVSRELFETYAELLIAMQQSNVVYEGSALDTPLLRAAPIERALELWIEPAPGFEEGRNYA